MPGRPISQPWNRLLLACFLSCLPWLPVFTVTMTIGYSSAGSARLLTAESRQKTTQFYFLRFCLDLFRVRTCSDHTVPVLQWATRLLALRAQECCHDPTRCCLLGAFGTG